MSLISMYNAYVMAERRRNRPERTIPKPRNLTLRSIILESPRCVEISEKLNIELTDLLVIENYRNAIRYIKKTKDKSVRELRIENYDCKDGVKLFLLKQAANRIEHNQKYKNIYLQKTPSDFKQFREKILEEYGRLRLELGQNKNHKP